MTSARILLTTAKVLTPEISLSEKHSSIDSQLRCKLCWRQGKILVKYSTQSEPELPALRCEQWLRDCLRCSSAKIVCLDAQLGETTLKHWAKVCAQTNKITFLHGCSGAKPSPDQHLFSQWFNRCLDWLCAALLLLLLSPVLAMLMLLIKTESPGPVFHTQWRIGQRGRLFRVLKFRTLPAKMPVELERTLHGQNLNQYATPLGRWLRKYYLDNLPQLINVLQGKMSLVGTLPLTLGEAAKLQAKDKKQLSSRPGIINLKQVLTDSSSLDAASFKHPGKDLKI